MIVVPIQFSFLSFSNYQTNNLIGNLREALTKKKMFSFGHCPKRGGGRPLPEFFDPVLPPCCPLYFDINIMLCDTFWSFLTPKSSKVQNYYHNYHSHHCRNHCYLVL